MIGKGKREKSTREEEVELWAGEVLEVDADVISEMAEADEVVVVKDELEVEDAEED